MSYEINDQVTDLAKKALDRGNGWVTLVVLALWGFWLAWKLSANTKALEQERLAASKAKLDALEAANAAKVAGVQAVIEKTTQELEHAEHAYALVERNVAAKLAEAEEAKARVAKLTKWEELDALAQGR